MAVQAIAKRIKTVCCIFLNFQKRQKVLRKKNGVMSGQTKSIEFSGKRRLKLKDDAVPTENKPLHGTSEGQNGKDQLELCQDEG